MLKVKSFAITDHDGMNDLLSKTRLAAGAHILVSDGFMCIPYEDGEPATKEQQIVAIKEEQNGIIKQRDIIIHSNGVMDHLIADAQDRVNVAQAAVDKNENSESYVAADIKKDAEKKLAEVISARDQAENQKTMNAAEIVRLNLNLQKFDEAIAALNA